MSRGLSLLPLNLTWLQPLGGSVHTGLMGDLEYEPMAHDEKIQWMLDEHGWGAVPVRPAESSAPGSVGYTYTFGLETAFGQPEILICGMQPVQARGLLDLIVAQYAAGVSLPADTAFVGLLDNELPAALITLDVAKCARLVPTAAELHTEQAWRLHQFVWPDANGALPWDDACSDEFRRAQPVLA